MASESYLTAFLRCYDNRVDIESLRTDVDALRRLVTRVEDERLTLASRATLRGAPEQMFLLLLSLIPTWMVSVVFLPYDLLRVSWQFTNMMVKSCFVAPMLIFIPIILVRLNGNKQLSRVRRRKCLKCGHPKEASQDAASVPQIGICPECGEAYIKAHNF